MENGRGLLGYPAPDHFRPHLSLLALDPWSSHPSLHPWMCQAPPSGPWSWPLPLLAPSCRSGHGPYTFPDVLPPFPAQLNFPLHSYHFLKCCTMSFSSHTHNSLSLSCKAVDFTRTGWIFVHWVYSMHRTAPTQNRCTINILKYMLMTRSKRRIKSEDKQVTRKENWGQIVEF